MRYVLGVDGGQTSTTAVITDATGCLLGIGHGGPANHIHEPGGVERVRRSLTEAVRGAIRMADLENARIAAACLGMTGGTAHMQEICAPVVPTDRLIFGHDTKIALYSVTFGRPGVVVIAGTGAAAYGINAEGEEASAGGWGYLLGDEGSGYWIAVRGLNACCRASDGIAPPTQILPLLLQHLAVPDLKHVHKRIYSGAMTRPDIAALSEVVGRAAVLGDAVARRILREAGKELALIANKVLLKLCLETQPVTVGTVGGVFRSGRLVLRSFREVVQRVAPQAAIVPARVPAAVGAALLALEAIGVPADDGVLTKVEFSLPRLGAIKT
ncbi:MAG TPA: BadF/BadG/BcrA/BcrD ATPase family protein [Chthonomonadaceae bacterium]|nr:BadF/BadG/BcrA/BcrD ATPase family protein [Chthonomonadaceae bacterium]